MTLSLVSLGLSSLVFLAIGVAFLFWPVAMGRTVEIELTTPTALIDFRATYGGFVLAVGIFFAWCAAKPEWIKAGLAAQALILAGFGFTRGIGMLIAGSTRPLLVWLLVAELVGTGLGLYCYLREGQGA